MSKETCHGLPPSRSKGGHAPGNSPGPAWNRLRLGQARCATTTTHRLVRGRESPVTDRGPGQGIGRSLALRCTGHRGRCKACGEAAGPRDRASRGYGAGGVGPSPAWRGEGAGGGSASNGTRAMEMNRQAQDLVPMPGLWERGAYAERAYAFALCGSLFDEAEVPCRIGDCCTICYVLGSGQPFDDFLRRSGSVSENPSKAHFFRINTLLNKGTDSCLGIIQLTGFLGSQNMSQIHCQFQIRNRWAGQQTKCGCEKSSHFGRIT